MKKRDADGEGRDGLHKETFRDGKVSAVGKYASGKKTGVWKFYFRNGSLRAVGTLKEGQLHGPWK
jgi:antitoxin component YwqK of YwqJK toxin-antitoxin module